MLALPAVLRSDQLTTFDRATRNKTVFVRRGSLVSLPEVAGTGFIARLWITFPGWFWQHWAPEQPVNQSILKTLILRIYFDGSAEPQVAAPVGDFFGIGLCEVSSFVSHYLGMSSGGFYCTFPMPYRTSFRIEFDNRDSEIDTSVFCNVLYQSVREFDSGVPCFHAFFESGSNSGSEPLVIADVAGRGKFVGCTLSCQGEPLSYLSFLEAPEHVYVDGESEPRITGTGMEDYFLGGWYFREGPFAGPHHGVPVKDALQSSVAMYRIHELDAIHFERSLRFTFENPWDPTRLRAFRHSSVAFLYLDRPTPAPAVPDADRLLHWYRVRNCDHQSIP